MKVAKMNQAKKEPAVGPLFTGPVTMQTFVDTDLSKRFMIRQVNFDRGVRNKFHSHTIEQVLIVTEGKGIVATDKEKITVVPGNISLSRQGRNTGTELPRGLPSPTSTSCRLIVKQRSLRNSNYS